MSMGVFRTGGKSGLEWPNAAYSRRVAVASVVSSMARFVFICDLPPYRFVRNVFIASCTVTAVSILRCTVGASSASTVVRRPSIRLITCSR